MSSCLVQLHCYFFPPCYIYELIFFFFVCSNLRVRNVIQLHETIVALKGRAE